MMLILKHALKLHISLSFKTDLRVSVIFGFPFGLFLLFVGLLFLNLHLGPSQLSAVKANSDQLS